MLPAARLRDEAGDAEAPDPIIEGSPTVRINSRLAVRVGDQTLGGGKIAEGSPNVRIGDFGRVNEAPRTVKRSPAPAADLNLKAECRTQVPPPDLGTPPHPVDSHADESWFGRQWGDFVSIISDPGFWVGLAVGLLLGALAVFLGPVLVGALGVVGAALAVGAAIGAVSAGAGTIVSNLCKGAKPWYTSLGSSMLVGAVFGAFFALMEGVLIAIGAGLLVSIAVMAVLAAEVGVILNLISGERWDKGLLANLAFAGLFAWVAKFFRKSTNHSETAGTASETSAAPSEAAPAGGRVEQQQPVLPNEPEPAPPVSRPEPESSQLPAEPLTPTHAEALPAEPAKTPTQPPEPSLPGMPSDETTPESRVEPLPKLEPESKLVSETTQTDKRPHPAQSIQSGEQPEPGPPTSPSRDYIRRQQARKGNTSRVSLISQLQQRLSSISPAAAERATGLTK
jgi:hypothetical protein